MIIQKSTENLIDAIHRTRREISDFFDGNIMAIAEDAAQRQALSNRPVWQPKADNVIVGGLRKCHVDSEQVIVDRVE